MSRGSDFLNGVYACICEFSYSLWHLKYADRRLSHLHKIASFTGKTALLLPYEYYAPNNIDLNF
jgi:hypothetical protein